MKVKTKHTSYTLIYLSVASFFIILLSACNNTQKPGIYKGDQISSGTRSKLHKLNDDLLAALKTNNPEDLELLMSQAMIDDRHNRLVTTEEISIRMKSGDYSLMSEYYMVADPKVTSATNTIKERDLGINNFDLTFAKSTEASEMYVAFFTAEKAMQKWLVTAIYNKYNYGWKVDRLEVKPYAENGMTAPELMEKAKALIKDGYWLDGSNTASYAKNCLQPYSTWRYVNEKAIKDYNYEALDIVKSHYKLPIVISSIPTHPRIWRIRIERTPDGSFPNVNVLSSINLLDTVALKKENEAIRQSIGSVMNGIDKDKKYIYYTTYNETKQGVAVNDHYDFVQKLK